MAKTISTSDLATAARIIREGGLVAFPTETVYGLGANALDEHAVDRIFRVKGRPATSPLIVHAHSLVMAKSLAAEWPPAAEQLAAAHWPGPVTLVVPKASCIPERVTAGLPTVGLRVPSHPVALALIREAGVPIAAPSANRFTGLSPTESRHLDTSLADFVLEGESAEVGIESTVVAIDGDRITLLRPGVVTIPGALPADGPAGAHMSPGLHPRHYAPKTKLILGVAPAEGRGYVLRLGNDPTLAARLLYSQLHDADRQGYDWISVELPPDTPEWAGIRDRLMRAAAE